MLGQVVDLVLNFRTGYFDRAGELHVEPRSTRMLNARGVHVF